MVGEVELDDDGAPKMDEVDLKIAQVLSEGWKLDAPPGDQPPNAAQYVHGVNEVQERFAATYASNRT